MSEEIETPRSKGGLGSLALILIFGAVIAVLGKSLYAEYAAGGEKTGNPIWALDGKQEPRRDPIPPPPPPGPAKETVGAPAPPAPPEPVPTPGAVPQPVQADVEQLAVEEESKAQSELYAIVSPKLNQIKGASDQVVAQGLYRTLEGELRAAARRCNSGLVTRLRNQGADEARVNGAVGEVDKYAEGWLRAAREEVSKRPGAPVAAVGPVPAGGESLDIITGDPRKEVYRFGAGPMTRNEALPQIERQCSVWNFLLRANQVRTIPEESFIWDNLCNRPEQQAADNEFKRKDLIDSKRADFATRMEEVGRIKTIRLRSQGKFGQYDFKRGCIEVTSYQTGFATLDRTYGLASSIALSKLESGQVRQLLPVTLTMDEETARAITANNPERLVWIDVEGTIVPSHNSALAVSTTRAIISSLDGSRTWEVPVK